MGADVGADGAGLGTIKRSDMHGRRFEEIETQSRNKPQHRVAPTTAAKQSCWYLHDIVYEGIGPRLLPRVHQPGKGACV